MRQPTDGPTPRDKNDPIQTATRLPVGVMQVVDDVCGTIVVKQSVGVLEKLQVGNHIAAIISIRRSAWQSAGVRVVSE